MCARSNRQHHAFRLFGLFIMRNQTFKGRTCKRGSYNRRQLTRTEAKLGRRCSHPRTVATAGEGLLKGRQGMLAKDIGRIDVSALLPIPYYGASASLGICRLLSVVTFSKSSPEESERTRGKCVASAAPKNSPARRSVCGSLSPALKPLSYSLADRVSAGGSRNTLVFL